MRKTFAVLSLTSCLPLTGCMGSLRIRSARDFPKPQGLPFYAKAGACKQQTIWLEYRYEVSAPGFPAKTLNQTEYGAASSGIQSAAKLEDLTKAVGNGKETPPVSDLNSTDLTAAYKAGNLAMASNSGEMTTVADYTNLMWLNSARPLAGSTQVSAEFNPDGTLTKASAQMEDKTLSTVTDTVKTVSGLGFMAMHLDAFQVTVKKTVLTHTHTQYVALIKGDLSEAMAGCSAPANPVTAGSWTVTSSDDKPAADKKI